MSAVPGKYWEVLGIQITEDGSLPLPGVLYSPLITSEEEFPYPCHREISLLIKTKADIDDLLLDRIQKDQRFCVRYRALYILAVRQPRRAVPTIEEWWNHPKPLYRLAAWRVANALAERMAILPVLDRHALLRAYAAERESDIRAEVAKLLGETKASFAVDALIAHLPGHRQTASETEFRATIEKGLGPQAMNSSVDTDIRSLFERTQPENAQVRYNEGCSTVWALGRIGDSRATEAVIEVARGSPNWSSACHETLGRIGSEEAIDFLIAHLHDSEAVRATWNGTKQESDPSFETPSSRTDRSGGS